MPAHRELPEQFGRYRILGRLGQGGMGTVFLAEDTQLDRQVAIKIPHIDDEAPPTVLERFYREARVAAALDHPNLCPVHDVGQLDGIHFIVMPFIEGKPLSHFTRDGKPWPPRQAVELIRRVALALAALHDRGIVHRDLKPGNVMMRPSGEPVLMDFGLARSVSAASQRITTGGGPIGTPAYMAPEQVNGEGDRIGPPTDVYSLGVILYELVTGRLPFEGTLLALFGQILHTDPEPPSKVRPGLDPRIEALCLKAMAKKLEDRFPSAEVLAQSLVALLEPADRAIVPLAGGQARPAIPTMQAEPDLLETRVECPGCGNSMRIPPELLGKRVKCTRCQKRLGQAGVSHTQKPSQGTLRPEDTSPTAPPELVPTGGPTGRGGPLLAGILTVCGLAGLLVWMLMGLFGKGEGEAAGTQHAAVSPRQPAPPPVVHPITAVHPDPGTLEKYRGQIGKSFRFKVTGSTSGYVYGTDTYTDDSSLATAAVHAGILREGEMGEVWVTILPGQDSYQGSDRHGVSSRNWTSYGGSYRIAALPQVATEEGASDSLVSHRSDMGRSLSLAVKGARGGPLWGDDAYTDHSSLSAAVVHAGLLNPDERGIVRVTILPGRESYPAVTRNEVSSKLSKARPASFRIDWQYRLRDIRAGTTDPLPYPGSLAGFRDYAGSSLCFEVIGYTSGPVWGTDVYGDDSSLSTAVVHAGLLKAGEEGIVRVVLGGRQLGLQGSGRNGVTSQALDRAEGSFRLERVTEKVPAREVLTDPGSPGKYRGQNGRSFLFKLTGSTTGSVYGTGIYTDDSSLATAAVHAGLLRPGQERVVRAQILPGRSAYAGSRRHRVISSEYGYYPGSYRFRGLAPVVEKPPEKPAEVALPDPGSPGQYRGQNGKTFSFKVTGSTTGSVYGTDIYTDDSTLATAAIHASLLTAGETKVVRVTILPGQASYQSSTRNGIKSWEYAAWSGSYRFEDAPRSKPARPRRRNVLDDPGAVNALRLSIGQTYLIEVTGTTTGSLWGTRYYTDDSSLATAAVHWGVVRAGEKAVVKVTIYRGAASYSGSLKNGVQSSDWGPYEGFSFTVERAGR
jgi:predicted Ser/Thr protein kinase